MHVCMCVLRKITQSREKPERKKVRERERDPDTKGAEYSNL